MPGGIFGEISNTPEISTGNPATVNDATAKMPIGATFRHNGKKYRYVRFNNGTGNVAPVAGGPAWPHTITVPTSLVGPVFTVTADQTDSIMERSAVGAFLGVPTDGNYCCIQIGGIAQCVVPGGVEGDMVIGSATDNQFDRIAAGSNLTRPLMGIRMEGASASGLSPVLLMNMDW